jgi:PAS domain S-box-containing protein
MGPIPAIFAASDANFRPLPLVNPSIIGSGEMAALVRTHDWGATPLGPLASWSKELVAVTNLMLASPMPSALHWGPNLIIIYNDAYRQLAGPRHPSALGQRCQDVWREAWPIFGPLVTHTYESGEVLAQENFLIPIEVDGKMQDRYWNFAFAPVYEQGRVAGLYNYGRNDTEAFLGARKLRESEARAQRVLKSIADAVIVTDADAHVTRMNKAAALLTGWRTDEAQGRLLTEVFRTVSEKTRLTLENPVQKVKRLGVMDGHATHAILIAKDGTERFIDDQGSLIRNEDGDVEGMVLVFRDVSEKRQAERERERLQLELSAKYFEMRAIYETSSVALAMIDPHTLRYLRGNPKLAEMLNQTVDELIGTPVFDLANDVLGLRDALQQAASGTPVMGKVIEGELANSPGVHRWWQVEYVPVFSEDGKGLRKVEVIVASSIEITGERQMQAALLQTEKLAAVGRLAALIAHEINNPLESVTNLLYLARTSQDFAEVQDYLATAEEELQRVSLITNQTLRFHRQATKPTPALCPELMAGTLSVFHGRLRNSQVVVEERYRPCKLVSCFDGEIRQVLNNLVGNGIDAMYAAGGRLLLRCREATHWRTGRRGIAMTVGDTGPGMSAEVKKRIFDPFFTTKGIGGTGLGLWVSHEIVERHQGSLCVRSSQRPERSGTVFRLFLPWEAEGR